jgi:hypothetical protein
MPGEASAEGSSRNTREPHDGRAEHNDPAVAVPARAAAAEESVSVAFAGQAAATAAVPPGAKADADRQATAFNPLFLAPASARPGAWLWGASADWLGLITVGDVAVPQGGANRPAAAFLPADEAGDVAAAALPEGGGLAAGFLPADTTALEQAVRRFLGGLDAVGRELTRVLAENAWTRWAAIVAVTALAAELGRRHVQGSSRQGASVEEDESATRSWLAGSYPFRPEDI